MEKMTRVKKYKELRDSMKEEVSIERQNIVETVEDDDFLSFLPKQEVEVNIEDTLMNPLSYETLDESSKEVKDALNMAKMNVGKDQFNTRLDILNKIKSEDLYKEDELKDADFSNGHVVNHPQKKMSLLEKLASMSPEEDVKELEKFEQTQKVEKKIEKPVIVEEKPKQIVNEVKKEDIKKEKKEIIKEETEEIKLFTELMEEENKEEIKKEKSDKLLTVLNCIIIILIIAFLCFIGIFAYQLFF